MAKKRARKRANGEGTTFQRTSGKDKGKYYARIYIKQVDGKMKPMIRKAESKEHAALLLKQMRKEHQDRNLTPSTMTISQLMERWFEKQKGEPSTLDGHERAIRLRINPLIGRYKIREFSSLLVEDWIDKMKEMGVGERSQQQAFQTLNRAYNYSLKHQLQTVNPCTVVDAPQCSRKPITIFTDSEVEAILKVVSTHRLVALFQLAFTTGMRQSEIFGLQWSDLDWAESTIRVHRQAREYKGVLEIKKPKTESGLRSIKLTEQTMHLLRDRRKTSLKEGHASHEFIFTSAEGAIIRRNNFGKRIWKNLLVAAEINHRGFHHVRHTAATILLRKRVPVHIVSGILGHSSVSITLDLYSHYITSDSDQASEAMQNLGS